MAANRNEGLDWLVGRMEWERNLRSLHDRVPASMATGANLAEPDQARGRSRRPTNIEIRA